MKKILLVTAAAATLFTFGQVQASDYLVHAANAERAEAYRLNAEASAIEAEVRHALRHGHNPVHLRHEAKALRDQATREAWASNHLAKDYYASLQHYH